jgi:hypothetical protein
VCNRVDLCLFSLSTLNVFSIGAHYRVRFCVRNAWLLSSGGTRFQYRLKYRLNRLNVISDFLQSFGDTSSNVPSPHPSQPLLLSIHCHVPLKFSTL